MARLVHVYMEDFCCIKSASLPLLNQGLLLVLGDNKDTLAAVNNGAGKTTLLKAITWCLFGETLDKDKFDKVIRWGAKRAYVRQVFERSGALWIVRRWRTKGSPGLSLSRANTRKFNVDYESVDQVPWEGSSDEVQAKIIELLGKDFRAFCNTQFFGQNDDGRFLSSTDSARKESIHRVLRSDVFRRTEKYLREHVMREFRQEVTDLDADLRSVRDKMSEHDVADLRARSDEFDLCRQDRIDKILESINEIPERLAAGRRRHVESRGECAAKIAELLDKVNVARCEKLLGEAKTQEGRLERIESEMRDRQGEIGGIVAWIGSVKDQIARLKGDKCPTCSAPLDQGEPLKLKTALTERLANLIDGRDEFASAQEDSTRERDEVRSRLTELRRSIQEVGELSHELDQARQDMAQIDKDFADEAKECEREAKSLLARIQMIDGEANPFAARIRESEARIKELELQERSVLSKLEPAVVEMQMREFWLNAFGPQGIPSMLLDSVMPYMTERTNYYLEILTDGDITVEIDNQRGLKKGGKKDEITVTCNIEGVPDSKPSTAQRNKIEIASNLGLMDLAIERDGESDLLVMDDVMNGLDCEGVSRVMALLDSLRSKKSSIIVATPDPSFVDSFDHAVLVTKENKSSVVTEIK